MELDTVFKLIADHQAGPDVQSWLQIDKQSKDIAHGKCLSGCHFKAM